MAAGLGYKEFTTGDVLTAADANGYLASQVVMVFADAAARTSAIASPQEGMISYLKDTNATESYSGSAWVAIGATGGGLTLLSTTSLTGTATTVSSINQTYTNLFIVIEAPSSSASFAPALQYNGVTSGYFSVIQRANQTSLTNGSGSGIDLAVNQTYSSTNSNSYIEFSISNYAVAGYHAVRGLSNYFISGASEYYITSTFGANGSTAAITSITLVANGGSFDAGSIKIYGVK